SADLGAEGRDYLRLIEPFARQWSRLSREILRPLLHLPRRPLLLAQFGRVGLRSAKGAFGGGPDDSRLGALLAGSAAHAGLSLSAATSAAFALVLHAAGHAAGWPFPRGGAGRLAD